MSAIDQFREDLRLDCTVCWASSVCSEHGPVPTDVVVKKLLNDHYHLSRRYEEARQNLAVVLGMPQDTEFIELIAELQWRTRPAARKRMTAEQIVESGGSQL